jgi:tetratricopeptide (TPR) repeat protein
MHQIVGRAVVVQSLNIIIQIACGLLLAGVVFSQGGGGIDMLGTGGRHSIQGRIYYPSGQRADARTKIKLESVQYGERTVLADLNGTFSFKSLAPGSYTVVVEGGSEYETSRENVLIDTEASSSRADLQLPSIPRSYQVQVFLQPKRGVSTKPGVVNAELAGVSEPARSFYEKGLTFAKSGETEKAIEQLKQAVAYYPEFVLALNELGVQYLKAGLAGKAVEVLEKAIRLKPDAFSPRLNYGIALLQNRKYAEAETHLRQAVSSNNDFATTHLYLGMTLIHLSKYDEAERELVKAIELAGSSPYLAQAHYYLGGIYWRKKEYKLAADQLETYLKQSPNASDAEKVKATIATLREKS